MHVFILAAMITCALTEPTTPDTYHHTTTTSGGGTNPDCSVPSPAELSCPDIVQFNFENSY